MIFAPVESFFVSSTRIDKSSSAIETGTYTLETSAALLSLVLERSPHGIERSIPDACRLVDGMEVLARRLSNHLRVRGPKADVGSGPGPERLENLGTSGEVEGSEVSVGQEGVRHFLIISRNKRNNGSWQAGFDHDLAKQPTR